MLGEEQFQEVSEIPLFNLIGHYADNKGYGVVYFKVLMKLEEEYMHYIHLYKDEDLEVSIYFDNFNYIHFPYYEMYYCSDVQRFSNSTMGEMELLDTIKKIIK